MTYITQNGAISRQIGSITKLRQVLNDIEEKMESDGPVILSKEDASSLLRNADDVIRTTRATQSVVENMLSFALPHDIQMLLTGMETQAQEKSEMYGEMLQERWRESEE